MKEKHTINSELYKLIQQFKRDQSTSDSDEFSIDRIYIAPPIVLPVEPADDETPHVPSFLPALLFHHVCEESIARLDLAKHDVALVDLLLRSDGCVGALVI